MEILIAKNDKEIRIEQTSKALIVICEPENYQEAGNFKLVNVIVDDDNLHLGSILVIALEFADIVSTQDYLVVSVSDSRAIRVFDTLFPLEIL